MSVYLRLAGGLGNQFYQMAALALVSDELGLDPVVVVDGLGRYAAARQPDVFRLLSPAWSESICGSKLASWVVDRARAGRWIPMVGADDRNFWRIIDRPSRSWPLIMDGYFQSGWNLGKFARALNLLQPRLSPVHGGCENCECAVHVRGGDFLKVAHHQVIDHRYYARAIELARADGWARFLVVTDDHAYATTLMNQVCGEFDDLSWRLAPTSSDALIDFEILRAAPARIIGNSTFSWWATALDEAKGRTWAPLKFTLDRDRDFFLPWEVMIP
jgi:hypothetical protein